MQGLRRVLTCLAGSTLLTGVTLITLPGNAHAAGEKLGHWVPGQAYDGRPTNHPDDWLGSYTWKGRQVWCVQFALNEPADDVDYAPGGPLTRKDGEPLGEEVAAKISYLLLRYQHTTSADEAAAMAHLLHAWTAGTTDEKKLARTNGPETIGYHERHHYNGLPENAKAAVQRLNIDAEEHRGPWRLTLTPPQEAQTIGEADTWMVQVTTATGKPVGGVRVELSVTEGTLGGDAAGGTARTPTDGSPLAVPVTPSGNNPKLTVTARGPSPQPVLLVPSKPMTQRIITTGGETPLSKEGTVPARHAPGVVKLSKVDAASGATISGVSLRLTGADKESPARKHDDSKLTGPDGEPVVLRTGQDGTVSVPDLKAPQEICLIETAVPDGYDEAFDPHHPPTVCGTVTPGGTLALTLTNKANVPEQPVVPITIPAGADVVLASAATRQVLTPAGLVGLGGLGLLAAGLVGALCWRRIAARRLGGR
ncbi:hypothetical protein GCM10012275_43910 [Longimycelium tulufanense]|uniref:SpaA-like prealbumin fold domain-containing protein n=1 Tax=Longimycelium tulufanense TaxID=907463 RepID=A0A8J3FXJ1_9PSEU|nr:hypothetical protein [Longimycelium tulufanense]GGM68652.1 hypothetical protein GCM10012275_43910 [Longimycelium tulufanense]